MKKRLLFFIETSNQAILQGFLKNGLEKLEAGRDNLSQRVKKSFCACSMDCFFLKLDWRIKMGKTIFNILTLFIFAFIPGTIFSQDIPTPDEALRVVDFYNNGKGTGVILMESKICRDVHREGSSKYECKNEIIEFGELKADGSAPDIFHKIRMGDSAYIWMAYLVPVGAKEKIFLRYNLEGETKRTSGKLDVKGSIRYRTWISFAPPSKGTWEIEIFHDSASGPIKQGTFDLIVE